MNQREKEPDQRAENSRWPPMGLRRSDKIPYPDMYMLRRTSGIIKADYFGTQIGSYILKFINK